MTLQDMDILLAREREEYLLQRTAHAAEVRKAQQQEQDKEEIRKHCEDFARQHQEFLKEYDYGLTDYE